MSVGFRNIVIGYSFAVYIWLWSYKAGSTTLYYATKLINKN